MIGNIARVGDRYASEYGYRSAVGSIVEVMSEDLWDKRVYMVKIREYTNGRRISSVWDVHVDDLLPLSHNEEYSFLLKEGEA